MQLRHYPRVPSSAILEFGGYRLVKPADWEVYLQRLIQIEHPDYYQEISGEQENSLWRSNACILESLEKHLLREYGVSIPRDNLFKVYNQDGEGVPPELLLESIAAVIEPLGFEVERVIVPDPELRSALGDGRLTVGMEDASSFDQRPGVCMINIKPGESHAFFWERMDARRFHKQQFRLALTIVPSTPSPDINLSPSASLAGFCGMVRDYLAGQPVGEKPELESLARTVDELDHSVQSLTKLEHNLREYVLKQVNTLLERISEIIRTKPEPGNDDATVIEAGELIRKIYSDAPALGAG